MTYLPTREWLVDVQRGRDPGVSGLNKFGSGTVSTAGVPATIWSGGGLYVHPTAARIHQIVSANVADAAAGTGARTVTIWGLDANLEEQSETVTMNGTTNVPTTLSYLRVFRMRTASAGSNGTNVGKITATADTDTTVSAEIPTGKGGTFMAVWSVPAGKTAYIMSAWVSINRQGAASGAMVEFDLWITTGIDGSTPASFAAHSIAVAVNGSGTIHPQFRLPKKVSGPADIEIRATYSTDNSVVVNAGFDLVYE